MMHGTHNVTLTQCNTMHGTHNVTLTHCNMMHGTHNVILTHSNTMHGTQQRQIHISYSAASNMQAYNVRGSRIPF